MSLCEQYMWPSQMNFKSIEITKPSAKIALGHKIFVVGFATIFVTIGPARGFHTAVV